MNEKELGYIIWSVIFGIISTVFTPGTRTKGAWVTAFLVAIPIGWLAGEVSTEQGFSDSWTNIIVAIAALTAQHIIVAIVAIAMWVSDNAADLFEKFVLSRFKKK